MMVKYGAAGCYVTDIVKKRDVPRMPTANEIRGWTPFLLKEIEIIGPRAIVVLGQRTYKASFRPYVESLIPEDIKIDYVFHYSSQVPRSKFEGKFSDVLRKFITKAPA
jgi:uracil-DNA glycosylase family 4